MFYPEYVKNPAATKADGASPQIRDANLLQPPYSPWAFDEIKFGWDGYNCGLPVAARRALEYARDVAELDAMHAGCDWAGILCARANATRSELECRLPKDADERVKALALEGLV